VVDWRAQYLFEEKFVLQNAPNKACNEQGFALRVRGTLLAVVLVCEGVLFVRQWLIQTIEQFLTKADEKQKIGS